MAFKNIVFDMGNVLLQWDPYWPCYRHTRDQELAQKMNQAIFLDKEWEETVDSGIYTDEEYVKKRAFTRLDTAAERALALDIMQDYYTDALYPIRPMEELTGELLEKGYSLYLLSNAGFRLRESIYKIKNINGFSGIIISAEVGLTKPDERIYRLLQDQHRLHPEETLFVDDRPVNVEAAQKIGWSGFLFDSQNVSGLRTFIENS